MKSLLIYFITLLNTPPQAIFPINDTLPSTFPKEDFRLPLDIPLELAGNYGEPRRLHFHTGIDMRTNQMEGLNVYASANGYVSRINVSGSRYGKALYITHPNGYTTVYGHLQRFSDRIEQRLQQEQHTQQSFSVDFNLSKDELPVTQGEIVALSGNTGGSGGPHLHFEVRDSFNRPLNPMLFGFVPQDNIKPILAFLKFHPQDEQKYYSSGHRVRTIGSNGNYQITGGKVSLNSDIVSVAVNTWDKLNGSPFTMGIYGMRLFVNGNKTFEFSMNRMAFDERRSVISCIDYPIFMKEGRKSFYKCFVEPANSASLYSEIENRGIIDLSDGKEKDILIEVYDFAGNTSTCTFKLQKNDEQTIFVPQDLKYSQLLFPFQDNQFENEDVTFLIPKRTIFDTLPLQYNKTETADPAFFSDIHRLGENTNLLFDFASLKLKVSKPLPEGKEDKAVVVWKNEYGNWVSKGGKYENGFITAQVRELGDFGIQIDTIPPTIRALNIAAGKYMRSTPRIVFSIGDNLSGIKKFDTYIDGEWVISEYDAKTARLFHILDTGLAAGTHEFKVYVQDERNNESTYTVKFRM